jgi:hypothetical protein
MRLARIAPGASALDIRTFECARCRHIHTATAESDPMQSDAVLWLSGHDLRSPTWESEPWKEDAMEDFVHRENLKIFRRQLAQVKDDAQRRLLLRLLAEEEAKAPVAKR